MTIIRINNAKKPDYIHAVKPVIKLKGITADLLHALSRRFSHPGFVIRSNNPDLIIQV